MTTAVQHRRGTTAEHATFTGLEGEVTIDTTKDTAVIHDGVLAGGYALAKETLANVNPSTLGAITGSATASGDLFLVFDASTLTMKKITRAELNNAMEIDALANVTITGGTINGTTIGNTAPAAGTFTQANFGDNAKAIFGAGSDLQIYHDGTNSYVSDQGTGNLRVLAANFQLRNAANNAGMITAIDGGSVYLFDNGSQKLVTTATGIDVTGDVVASGDIFTNGGDVDITGAQPRINLHENDTTDLDVTLRVNAGDFIIETRSDAGAALGDRIRAHNNGDISFYEDTGTTAKFFWDASAERLGIGTASPAYQLEIAGGSSRFYYDNTTFGLITNTTGGYGRYLKIWNDNATGDGKAVGLGNLSGRLVFGTGFQGDTQSPADGEAMTILADGSVGINISAPTSPLHVNRGTDGNIIQANGANLTWDFILKGTNGSTTNQALYEMGMYRDDGTTGANTVLKFGRGGSEANGFFAIDQNGTEALRINQNRSVYIGENVTGYDHRLAVVGGTDTGAAYFIGSGAASWGVEIGAHSQGTESDLVLTANAVIGSQDSLSNVAEGTGYFRWLTGGTSHKTGTAGATERVRIDADGIKFNGDTASTNALDDYEEGTWTLEFYDANTGGNQSPTTTAGKYTKIGNVVHIYLNTTIANIDTTGMTAGNLFYFTLPFVPSNDNFSGSMSYDQITPSGAQTTIVPFTAGGRGYFKAVGTGTTGDVNIAVSGINSGVTDMISLSMTYTTGS